MPLPVRPRRARPQTGNQIHIHKQKSKVKPMNKKSRSYPHTAGGPHLNTQELKHICNLSRLTGKLGRNKCMNEEITLWLASLHWE